MHSPGGTADTFDSVDFSQLSALAWDDIDALALSGEPVLESAVDCPRQENCANQLLLPTSAGDLQLQITDLGIRLRTAQCTIPDYGLLVRQPLPAELKLDRDGNDYLVTAGEYVVRIGCKPLSLVCEYQGRVVLQSSTDGHFVRRHRVPPFARTDHGWLMSLALGSGEPVYGLGEKWGALNKRGQLLRSYNHDALGVNAELSYKNVPFAWSPSGWGVFAHTPSPVTHAVGFAPWSQRSYCMLVEEQSFDVFVFAAEQDCAEGKPVNPGISLIESYTRLTGRAPMPPLFSGGVILSKAYYRTADEILDAAREVRKRGMPCDVITFDGRAWQDTDTRFAFEWDASRYPDPDKVVAELKDMSFKICVWEYPLISTRHRWFKEFADKGWLIKDQRTGQAYEYDWDQRAFGEVLTPLPRSGIVDFTHPDAYEFWCQAHKPLFDLGVDMIKADFGEQIEDHMLAHNGDTGHALHNVYAHLYNRCVYEAAERYSSSGPFLFSRSAWTGCQRYNSQWGGDPQADWEGMIGNIRGGLSWGLSGAPFYATDVGGFYKDTRDDALYVRWAQAGIFSAHFRLHGIGAREPWSYGPEAESAVLAAIELRYRLQHYLRRCMRQATETGIPVQRPMVLALPHEPQAWAFENQFMFGDDLLVVPCFDPAGKVEFYLPEGHWYPFDPGTDHSHDLLLGKTVYQQTLRLDQMAVFARSGTRIPLCKAVQSTAEHELSGDDELAVEQVWIATSRN